MKGTMERTIHKWIRLLTIVVLDILFITASGGIALLARFDFSFAQLPDQFIDVWLRWLPAQIMITLGIFLLRKMYHYMWRSVSAYDALGMIASVLMAYGVSAAAGLLAGCRLPRSVYFIALICQLITLVGLRCSCRFYDVLRIALRRGGFREERIMLIGAGEAGRVLLRELRSSPRVEGTVCCIIDDDVEKRGRYLNGVRIIGGREKIPGAVRKLDITQIIFAIPTATAKEKREILDICKMTGCRLRVLPGLYQLVNGEVSLQAVKDVQVEDLLGREMVRFDKSRMYDFLHGKTVLVTGGGGSIGSELCRQVAAFFPRQLIILDIYENNAYDIQQELRRAYGDRLDLRVEIASVRDRERMEELFLRYRPQLVFHAAAHKHVPLMEDCPREAIKNNIFGTYHVVCAAERAGVEKFVMISTDKAVNPTNVMGATKRFCEMILQSRSESATEFVSVRFGNVLGSNGSVVPLFRRQIAEGGPVTITDKRIIRYFMTIPEASQLVLEAAAMARQGQVFVLDMGEPVKILTLAENLIRLSGLEPYKDIQIVEIGLRPGEKLYEELLMNSEHLSRTENKRIFIEQQRELRQEKIMTALRQLAAALEDGQSDAKLVSLMKRLVPTYHDAAQVNRMAGAALPPEPEGRQYPAGEVTRLA